MLNILQRVGPRRRGYKFTEKEMNHDSHESRVHFLTKKFYRKAEVDKATLPHDGVMSWTEYEEEKKNESTNKSNKKST
jgi:hypothetical protein